MIGCVLDLSFVGQACRSCDELLYGLIYFQTGVDRGFICVLLQKGADALPDVGTSDEQILQNLVG